MPRRRKDPESLPIRTMPIDTYCEVFKVSRRTVWRRAQQGLIKLVKLGGVGRTLVVVDGSMQPVEPGTRGPAIEAMLRARAAKSKSGAPSTSPEATPADTASAARRVTAPRPPRPAPVE